jgi:hypothetical protein
MDMWRFTTVKGDKEETIRTYSQNSRHSYPARILPPRRIDFNQLQRLVKNGLI